MQIGSVRFHLWFCIERHHWINIDCRVVDRKYQVDWNWSCGWERCSWRSKEG